MTRPRFHILSVMVVVAGAAILLALLRAYPRSPIEVSFVCALMGFLATTYTTMRHRRGRTTESRRPPLAIIVIVAILILLPIILMVRRALVR